MTVKRRTIGILACSFSVVLLSACGSAREKEESLAPGPAHQALPTPANGGAGLHTIDRVSRARAARALEAIGTEARLAELDLKRLTPVAQTAVHAQSLIDKIEDPVARERARKDLGLAVDRSVGSTLSPGQLAIVHRHILASGNP